MKTARRVKVLHVLTGAMKYDGPTMSALRYSRAMDPEKVQTDFAAIAAPSEGIAREISGMGGNLHIAGNRLKRPLRYLMRLKKIVREGRYDVVQVHGNSCTMAIDLLAAKLGGAKVRLPYSINSSCKFRLAHRVLRPLFDRLYTDALACGDQAGEWLYPGKPYRIARIAVETEKYAFDPAARERMRRELGAGDGLLLGSVANLNPVKNHAFLLDVFAEYRKIDPAARLFLVGDGPLREAIRARIAELGLEDSVTMLGSRTDAAELIQAFDVMLLPSLYEGFPNVLVEWQCAGLRALVSDSVTRSADMTGLVEYLNLNDGAKKWAERLAETELPRDRAETSRAAVEEIRRRGYDIAESARELQEFYIEKTASV